MVLYRKDGNVFTNKDAYDFLTNRINDVFADVKAKYGLYVGVSDTKSVHTGNTLSILEDSVSESLDSVTLGLGEFSGQDNRPADSFDLVGSLVAMCHEKAHVDQCIRYYKSKNPLDRLMCASYCACNRNDGYYYQNYMTNIREIDAQERGLLGAYDILCQFCEKDIANKLICEYQNRRSITGYDFIQNKDGQLYQDISEILDAFDEVYEKSFHNTRQYNIYGKSDDVALDKFKSSPENRKCFECFLNEKDGFKQDIMMTSISMGNNENFYNVKCKMKSISSINFLKKLYFRILRIQIV